MTSWPNRRGRLQKGHSIQETEVWKRRRRSPTGQFEWRRKKHHRQPLPDSSTNQVAGRKCLRLKAKASRADSSASTPSRVCVGSGTSLTNPSSRNRITALQVRLSDLQSGPGEIQGLLAVYAAHFPISTGIQRFAVIRPRRQSAGWRPSRSPDSIPSALSAPGCGMGKDVPNEFELDKLREQPIPRELAPEQDIARSLRLGACANGPIHFKTLKRRCTDYHAPHWPHPWKSPRCRQPGPGMPSRNRFGRADFSRRIVERMNTMPFASAPIQE